MVSERTFGLEDIFNYDALDADKVLAELRDSGLAAVPGLLNENFRKKLVVEADKYFEEVPKADLEVIGPFEVKQQFNAKPDFEDSSLFVTLRSAFQELLLHKIGDHRVDQIFTGESLKFNYSELMRYPAGSVGISPHRDHAENINVVCIFAVGGQGFIYGCDDRAGSNPKKMPTYPGAVTFMRAPGFEGFKAKDRPFHYVADIDETRYSFAVRQVRSSSLQKQN
mmetsp:Transcript_35987/g.49963  ORF Transcript_35987/g.49963 Transcript_35987/m.49963 type:complete len:224 (+) Transcript_35987:76-747(+)|eukprot:CAMPEP_0196582242 /NCGR_PEP_ID=MMETSP1081-20130531/38189_1 /TAXON_ID=36882 /ORGANISM="Pyramimonas amylifera, Strain CCMP720" /LENGTH=223 /DNA_ID=CAMNT_0041902745 /DNA_START=74 /DNA_END=745 /DNA_ORIENTATION=+